jgi:hypothetical protein
MHGRAIIMDTLAVLTFDWHATEVTGEDLVDYRASHRV